MRGLNLLLSLTGLKPSMARIPAVLILSSRELSLSELCEATGYTKSMISEIMSVLEARGLVEASRVKRRVSYRVRVDALRKLIEEHLEKLGNALEDAYRESGLRDFHEIAESIRRRRGG